MTKEELFRLQTACIARLAGVLERLVTRYSAFLKADDKEYAIQALKGVRENLGIISTSPAALTRTDNPMPVFYKEGHPRSRGSK